MTVNLTDLAKSKLEEISNEAGIGHYSIRCKVLGGGCAGVSHDVNFDELVGELDDVIEFDGITVIIDPFSHSLLGDFTLDFVDTPMSQGFKFLTNASTHASCGCGNSTGLI
jgi:iron-sulfur cluster assembly accessory protein